VAQEVIGRIGRLLPGILAAVTLGVMPNVTRLLDAAAAGDPKATAELLPLVYDELRKLAAVRVAAEAPGHTLDATAFVHEAYLRLVGADVLDGWTDVVTSSRRPRRLARASPSELLVRRDVARGYLFEDSLTPALDRLHGAPELLKQVRAGDA
jgi:hypothetical protein